MDKYLKLIILGVTVTSVFIKKFNEILNTDNTETVDIDFEVID